MKKETPLTGDKLIKTAVNQILLNPETWKQSSWHSDCGTKHCIAGWCQILSGKAMSENAMSEARKALGISENEAYWLFASERTISDIYYFAKNFNRVGFNRAGFDRAGFNRAGFNRAGFDRAGFDRAGFNRAGFDRDGFDRDGFDRVGFNRAGFDRAGKKLTPFDL